MIRKKLFYLPFAGIGLSVIGLAASCGHAETTNDDGSKKQNDDTKQQSLNITKKAQKKLEFKGTKIQGLKFGAVFYDPDKPTRKESKENMDENGAAVGFQVISGIFKTAEEQKAWITNSIDNEGIRALVVGTEDDSVADAWSAKWKNHYNPVIAFDRIIHTSNRKAYNWYVTFDNSTGDGQLQAKAILANLYEDKTFLTKTQAEIETAVDTNKLKERKIVVALGGDAGDKNAHLLYDGAMNIIKAIAAKDSNLVVPDAFNTFEKVAQENWNDKKGQLFLDTALQKLSDQDRKAVAAVLSPNDEMAKAAIEALKANKIDPKEVYITGRGAEYDGIESIYRNTGQDMTIIKSDYFAATAVTAALAKELFADTDNTNVEPGQLQTNHRDKLLADIRTDFPEAKFRYDGTTYETATGKPINTLLLTPKIVDKDTLSTYYDVKDVNN